MTLIPLVRRGGIVVAHTLVDEADAAWLSQWTWRRDRDGYAVRYDSQNRRTLYMAREILGLKVGDPREADHRNRDKLDNRRANLRVVTHAQQMQNLPGHRGSSSRFRGVYWDKARSKWSARVQLNGVTHCLGRFDDEEEAAQAAAAFRAEHMSFAEEAA